MTEAIFSLEQPYVLLVEDDVSNLEVTVEILNQLGCVVQTATTRRQAELELKGGPLVDLLITDVNLDDASPADKSGIELASYASEKYPGLPIVGYSGKFGDKDISAKEQKLFLDVYLRGDASIDTMLRKFEEWKGLAVKHRESRTMVASAELERIRKKYDIDEHDVNLLREFIPNRGVDLSPEGASFVEEVLTQAGYTLRIIDSSVAASGDVPSVKHPFPIWVRQTDTAVILEAYECPELYTSGPDLDSAVCNLLELMAGFYQDIKHDSEDKLSPITCRMRNYLSRVFE